MVGNSQTVVIQQSAAVDIGAFYTLTCPTPHRIRFTGELGI